MAKSKLGGDDNNEGEGEDTQVGLDTIGCTANLVMVDYEAKKVFVANAGDSRCVAS